MAPSLMILQSFVCVVSPRYENTGLLLVHVRPSELAKTCPISQKASNRVEDQKIFCNKTQVVN